MRCNFEVCYFQVERRVVSQLAMAHERQLIGKGCTVKISAPNSSSVVKEEESDSEDKPIIPKIKLQVLKKGTFKDQFVDIDLSKIDNPFSTEFR